MIHLMSGTRMFSGLVGGEMPGARFDYSMGSWVMGNNCSKGYCKPIEIPKPAGHWPTGFQESMFLA